MSVALSATAATEALAQSGVRGVVTDAARLDGGVSNLTWKLERAHGAPVVLRLQREHGIFQPYDVLREARVLRCLAPSTVPVPRVLGTCADLQVLDAPFVVLEWLDYPHMGMVPMTEQVVDSYRATIGAIHMLDWRALGLAFLDPPAAGSEAAERDLPLSTRERSRSAAMMIR